MGCGASASSTSSIAEPSAGGPKGQTDDLKANSVSANSGSSAKVVTAPVETILAPRPEIRPCETADVLIEGTPDVQLRELLKAKPFLEQDNHFLRSYVDRCKKALASEDAEDAFEAKDLLAKLALELAHEEHRVAAAFKRFDNQQDHVLKHDEVDFMMDYLGFPNETDDVKKFVDILDKNDDDVISFDEFLHGVGRLGGCVKLFEVRRQQIEGRIAFKSSENDRSVLSAQLLECGIDQEDQEKWENITSGSEFDTAAALAPCQKEALRHIRAIAQMNHDNALPKLLNRVKTLNFDDEHLYMCLAWIRELSPIIIHINLDKVAPVLQNDTHYRNQFETNTSSGLLKPSIRTKWENKLFGPAYDDAEPFNRPKYGVQNVWNDHRGVMGCKQYGDSYLVLKDIRLRCTVSPQDSGNLDSKRLAVLDYYAHVLLEYSDKELAEILRISEGGAEKIGDSEAVIQNWGKYKEAQIHGPIDLALHVDRLVVSERHKDESKMIEEITQKHGWKVSWWQDMKEELEARAGGCELDAAQFGKMLDHLNDANKDKSDALESQAGLASLENTNREQLANREGDQLANREGESQMEKTQGESELITGEA